jgi:hypothetical protein
MHYSIIFYIKINITLNYYVKPAFFFLLFTEISITENALGGGGQVSMFVFDREGAAEQTHWDQNVLD